MEDPFGVTVLALNETATRLCIARLRRTAGLAWAQSVPPHVRFLLVLTPLEGKVAVGSVTALRIRQFSKSLQAR